MLQTLKSLWLAAGLCGLSVATAVAQVGVSITVAPPELRVVDQPLCPVEGYLWTPGYWGYGPDGYYWVDGVWVAPPRVGFLWTPGYWGYANDVYVFHTGYWGPTIGFYGGVDYGYGYFGRGYVGGGWQGGVFRYNTAVTHVNVNVIHNTYVDNHVTQNITNNRVSFNGRGGIAAQPDAAERRAASAEHLPPVGAQTEHREAASRDHNALAPNQPRPENATGRFPGHGGQGGTSQASRDAALGRQPHGPRFPGGQGGTSQASRDAALGNQHSGGPRFPGGQEGTSKASRDAALSAQHRPEQGARPSESEQRQVLTREASAPREPGVGRREGQPQPERVRQPGGGERAPQRAQQANPAPKPPRESNGGRQENKKEEKHP